MWIVVLKFVSFILLTLCSLSRGLECPLSWFDCGNGKCIAEIWHCDGDNDCGNSNDERECESLLPTMQCVSSQFECESDGNCIPERWHCDGDKDCIDGSDEKQCDNVTEECTGFRCQNHHCIPEKWRCDGQVDCSDGSDEELCSQGKLCAESEFLCSSGSCVNQTLVCNGERDCIDGSDEGLHCGDPCDNMTCSHNCKITPAGPHCYCNEGYALDAKDNKTCNDIDECVQEGFCSQKCINTIGSYKCSCQDGYELVNRTCKAKGVDPLLMFSTIKEVRGMHLRSNRYFLVRRAIESASAVDVDPKDVRIYWVEISKGSTVYSAKLDGSGFRTIISHGLLVPEDIAVDYIANNLYITDSGLQQVLACKTDGTICNVLHDTNVEKPRSLVLDHTGGFMYWSDWGNQSSGIYRSGMDGSRRISLVSTRIGWPNGIAIDHTTNRLYWADAKLNTIEFITLDGASRKVIVNSTVFHPYSLSVFEDSIYWSDWTTFSLESCNKFSGRKMTVLARENGRRIMGVHVYHPVLVAKVSNPCWSNDCSHICLISPGNGFRCACPRGFKLSTDQKTCTMEESGESLFVSEESSIFYIRPKSVGSEMLTKLPLSLVSAMITRVSYDSKSRYLFLADVRKPIIYAVNMTSFHMQVLVRNHLTTPEDLAFDWKSNNLYWIDSGKKTLEVMAINLLRRIVLLTDLMQPVSLAISPTSGHMFISTVGIEASVRMYGMDGKFKRILNSVFGLPMSIALHPTKSLLYWADPQAGTISFVNYSRPSGPELVKTKVVGVMSVAVSEDYVYWTARKSELNLLKGNVTHVLQLPGEARGLISREVTYTSGMITGMSRCLIGNGGCSYVCLTSPTGRTCACSTDMMLSDDNATCIARKCDATDFKCMNGLCLPAEHRCDGAKDCEDGSDEVGCSNRCSADDFQCENGRCIIESWHCDHRDDCGDNSDEKNCPSATTCNKNEISCKNGECISMLWRCDGEPDCSDSSDENDCHKTLCNTENHIRCDNGQCVPISWACDGSKDCYDGSDEKNCSQKAKTCSLHEFRCKSDGECVDENLKCDGRADCKDRSDEENCTRVHPNCKTGMFLCKDGACVYDYEVCDGISDCASNEDELNCTHSVCQPEEYLCPLSKRCILREWICDGDADCTDGSDEENCVEAKTHPPTLPPVSLDCDGFYCYVTSLCIPWSKVCDEHQDCEELADEGGQCSMSCSRGNGGCSHICQKTPYGSKCFCNKGYRLLPDNKTCDDINECDEPGTCSHFCSNTKGGFKCRCAEGYVLHLDHHFCKAEGESASLIYLLGDQIRYFDLSSHSHKVLISVNNADMRGMDYDAEEGTFYWTELNDGVINRYSASTRRTDVIVKSSSRPVVVKYDWIAKILYYRDKTSSICACTRDGKFCKTLIQPSAMKLDSFDISPTSGLMFWTIWANPHRNHHSGLIERAEMDGSHRIVIVSDKTNSPTAITVDHVLKLILWSDKQLNTLECADFHGLSRRLLVQSEIYHPLAVAVFEDFVYWADWGSDSIIRCHKFKKGNCETLLEGNVKAHFLLIVHKVMQPKVTNRCLNSNCQRMCLLTRSDYSCTCDIVDSNGTCTSSSDVSSKSFLPVSNPKLASECPKEYCRGGAECIIINNDYVCKCSPPYSGERCEVEASESLQSHDNNWIIGVILAIVVVGVIIVTLLCFKNRERIQRARESVTVKFRNPKSSFADRLVMDMDDGSACEELVIGQEKENKECNSDYMLNSKEENFKKWPSYERDSLRIGDSIVNFFQKLKNNSTIV